MRNRFDTQLVELNNELIAMGALCENAIASVGQERCLTATTKLAASAIRIDQEIDRKEREIESMCLKLLLQQQPVASDLRLISVGTEDDHGYRAHRRPGERYRGDRHLSVRCVRAITQHIEQMAQATIKMVTDSLDAFVRRDLTLAWSVIEY